MKNFVQSGDNITLTALAAVTSGQLVLIGAILGVAVGDAGIGDDVVLAREGVYTLPAQGVNDAGNSAIAQGDRLYYTAADDPYTLSKKASGKFAGFAIGALDAAGQDSIDVLLAEDPGIGEGDIPDGSIQAVKLAGGAGVAELLAAGLGASAAYTKLSNGALELLASDASARVALIVAVCTETFADNGGTKTAFIIGETDTTNKYTDGVVFATATAGDVFVFAGTLTANKALLVTANDKAGAGTGAISVTALVLPAAA